MTVLIHRAATADMVISTSIGPYVFCRDEPCFVVSIYEVFPLSYTLHGCYPHADDALIAAERLGAAIDHEVIDATHETAVGYAPGPV